MLCAACQQPHTVNEPEAKVCENASLGHVRELTVLGGLVIYCSK